MSDLSPLAVFSKALADLTAATAASVVGVEGPRTLASGFVWRPGLVLCAEEALPEEGEFEVVLPGGTRRPARLAGRDPSTDIALLRVEGELPSPARLDAGAASAGALALAIGAQGGSPLVALGVVARAGGPWRSLRGGEIEAHIELDLRPRFEAQGALVTDMEGRGLGMLVMGPRRRALVIPSATLERVGAILERQGRVPRGYLGLGLQPVRIDAHGGRGVMVMSVETGGPGDACGARQGDVIIAWNGEPVAGMRELMRALGPGSVGRAIVLGVRRGGQPLELTLTIGERPAA
ncbi:MAG TPA: S1C family serine protease [Caulobacteraceae bacterium]|jgi:S1-C subfamily serine protease|nr:S1C family serine protease [Caulobacteraceae bacterium]